MISIKKTLRFKKNSTLEDYNAWSTLSIIIANIEVFCEVMVGEETMPVATATNPLTVEIANFKMKNKQGWAHLLLSLQSNYDVKVVARAKRGTFDEGCLKSA